jgi:hypothetical protein
VAYPPRPGGRIVVPDTDYSSLTIDSAQTEVERRLARFTARRLRSGYVARRLRRLVAERGLRDLTVEVGPQVFDDYVLVRLGWLDGVERDALTAGAVADDALAAFRMDLRAADSAGGFFASLNHILVAGTR